VVFVFISGANVLLPAMVQVVEEEKMVQVCAALFHFSPNSVIKTPIRLVLATTDNGKNNVAYYGYENRFSR